MTTKDGYDDWMSRVIGGRKGRPLSAGESVSTSADTPEPFSAIEFVMVERPLYSVEIGKKGGDYIYHFYPSDAVKDSFEDKMGDAFVTVFKNQDRIEAVFTDELSSWAVRARGFAHNMWGDELAIKVLDSLDSMLEK